MSDEEAPSGGSSAPPPTSPATTPSEGASPSQTATETPSVAPEGGSSGFDFGSMFDERSESPDTREAGSESPLAAAPIAKQAEPVQPKPPEPAPPVQQQAEAAPAPVAKQPPAQPAAAPPAAPQIDPFDPGALGQHLIQNEEAAIQYTADNVFKLTQSEIEALETNAAEAVPRLMAKAFVKSQENVLSQLSRMVPAMIQRHLENKARNDTNESKFYTRWPAIKAEENGALVRKYAAVYRQMHPDTTLEQMIEDLGPMVMMAARIVPQIPSSGVVQGRPANPISQPATTAGRGPQPTPFVPAGAGAVNSSRAPELSPIELMFQDHG